MIEIHRRDRVVVVGNKSVSLTKNEHLLIKVFGMMDNKVVTYDLLAEWVCKGHPNPKVVLRPLVGRLKKKLGREYLECRKWHGYILSGNIKFV